jgi:hypothetical protein
MLHMAAHKFLGVAGLFEAFGRELADRLQHPEPVFPMSQKVLVDQ